MYLLYSASFCKTSHDGNFETKFEHLTVENGLSDFNVTCVLQDSKGFLWIATQNGLNRYDGYNFKIFRHSLNDSSSISSSYILTLFEDKKRNLWIGTNGGGLDLFISETETFVHFEADKNRSDWLENNVISSITEDSSGCLWLTTGWHNYDEGGLYRFDPQRMKFKCYFTRYKTIGNLLHTLLQPPDQRFLWVGGARGLFLFDKIREKFIYYSPKPTSTLISAGDTRHIVMDHENNLWLATWHGIKYFDTRTDKFKTFTQVIPNFNKDCHCQYMALDRDTTLWFGTRDEGLGKFNIITKKFIYFKRDSKNLNSLSNNDIRAICIDKNQNLWAGGMFGGLNKLDLATNEFNINPVLNQNHNFVNDLLSFYQENDSIIWLGSFTEGLIKYNLISKKTYINQKPVNKNTVWSILKDKESYIWTTTSSGIERYNKTNDTFESYYRVAGNPTSRYYIRLSTMSTLLEDNQRNLYLISPAGIDKFDFQTRRFEAFKENYPEYLQITRKFFYKPSCNLYFSYDMVQTDQGTNGSYTLNAPQPPFSINDINYSLKRYNDSFYALFKNIIADSENYKLSGSRSIGSKSKLNFEWLVFGKSGNLYIYKKGSEILPTKIHLQYNNIIYVSEDEKGQLWIVTGSSGIYCINFLNNSIRNLNKAEGYPFEEIYSALKDKFDNLWISSTGSLVKLNLLTEHFNVFSAKDGLLITCKLRLYQALNGEIFLGLNSFYPERTLVNESPPNIVITKVQLPDRIFNNTQCSKQKKPLILKPSDSYIRIEFSSLDFTAPDLNQYAYKLEGFDDHWINIEKNHFAVYTNLDPGTYTFHVKGSNSDGVWNEKGTSVSLIVTPPWWETSLAYILYALIIISIIYFTWRLQLKRIRVKHEYEMSKFEAEKLHEVDELKSRFFMNISHEFRTPLTLILGPVKQIIERIKDNKTKNDLQVVHKNANRLLGLVNELLDISRLESGNMKLQTCPQNIIPMLKSLVQSFCSYAERKRINLKFNCQDDEIIAYIDQEKIEKIITNLLSNAFKFTHEEGEIEVSVNIKYPSISPWNQKEDKCHFEGAQSEILGGDREIFSKRRIYARGVQVSPTAMIKNKLGRGRNDNNSFLSPSLRMGFVEISIRDNGIGIPEENIPKIFDRFYQVNASHTREQEGTGIGLALTKELVELHKGKIEVESEEGRGTTFTVSIPLGKEHLQPDEICDKEKIEAPYDSAKPIIFDEDKIEKPKLEQDITTEKQILLIVEDNYDVRNYIKDNLNTDYRILEAKDGEEGWNKSVENIPDLIISDVMMPKMDGFQLCNKLKTDERTSHIPVILLTAKAAKQDKIEGFETGADEYIKKPFEPDELNVRIKNLIEQRKRIHDYFRKHGLFEIEKKQVTPVDQKFLQKALNIINKNIADPDFNVLKFAENLAVHRSLLHKKLIALVGEPPVEFIRRIRLNRAAELIESKFGNISEIALEVGFNNPAYFSDCFKKQFGVAPSQYKGYRV